MVIVVVFLFCQVKCMDTCTQNQQKGSSSLDKLDNKPDCFFATRNAYLVYTTTLWTERCLTTLGIFWATKESQPYTCDGRRKVSR
jgi:hypothetical protein